MPERGLTYEERKAVYEKVREIEDCEGEIGMLDRCLALTSIIGRQRASYEMQLRYYHNRLIILKAELTVLENPVMLDVIKGKR